ncbi:MAG: flagellar basal-body rod protein FlgG [Alphaproteobacteria bacterium]|nr:flagellar basal-body rod protein FlgG [Alphaproteobacteria bacterium]
MRSLDIAATGMQAQQLYVDVTSQNLANINTTAYKLQRPEFQDLLYQSERRVGTSSSDAGTIVPTGVQIGLGVKLAAIYRNVSQGPVQQTSNPLDIALQGKGYFQVTMPDGTISYTRGGAFQLDNNGQIVTVDGYPMEPAITVPQNATSVTINSSGEVSVTLPAQTDPSIIGNIQIVNFVNEPGLSSIGNNLYQETTASGSPLVGTPGLDGFGTVLQNFLETSNVNPVTELTNLIKAQRVYEMNSKIVSKTDEMLQNLNQSV